MLLTSYRNLPDFAPGATQRLRTAIDERNEALKEAQRAREEVATLAEELTGVEVSEAILSEAATIANLFQASGGYANEKRDLPRIQADADGLRGALDSHARALGLGDASLLEAARPTAAALADLRRLISEGRHKEAARNTWAGRLSQERKEFEAQRSARERQGIVVNPGPLREQFSALGKVGEQARRLKQLRVGLAVEWQELGEAAARLDPPVGDLELLAKAPTPGAGDIAQFAKAFEQAERDARDARQGQRSVEKEIAETRARLATLVAGGPLATSETIAQVRMARDQTWRSLRSFVLRLDDAPPDAERPLHVAEFERRSDQADRLADEAARDAERLAAHALETHRLDEGARLYALKLAEVESASARRQVIEQRWAALWKGVCAKPLPPQEMRAWTDRVGQLLKTRDKLVAREAAQSADEADLARIEPVLRALAAEAGVQLAAELDCARLAERVEHRLDEIAHAWDASRDLETRFGETRRRLEDAIKEEADATSGLADWRRRWDGSVAALGLEAGASIEAAEAALETWKNAVNDGENYRDRLRRVEGMRRDMEQFEARADGLVHRFAPDLTGVPAEGAARILNDRLIAQREREVRRADVSRRLQAARRANLEIQARAAEADRSIAALSADLPGGVDLVTLLAHDAERTRLLDALREHRRHLHDVSDGVDEAKLAAEMGGFDPDAAEARLNELERLDEDFGREENDCYAERDRRMRERAVLESGVGAEVAWQQRRNAEAELVEAARRWAVLKASSLLIGAALERRRAAQRDPMMTRAGEVFAMLTGNAFAGLDQSLGEDDAARIEARRAGGGRVPVPGLSDGERDQLYLALRLAYIEDYAARAEAPPFIGDDIFPSFDDPRTAHGLEALAAIGDRVQPILFTHHQHVVDAAQARLGDAADIIRIG